jgi:hypothetical protein
MNDQVFNTLMSVALMCGQHLMGGGSLDNDMIPKSGLFEPGFEKCIDVVTNYRTEKARREKAAEAQQLQHDKDRVQNAMNAIKGKDFKPENAPPPRKDYDCLSVMPTSVPVNGGL